MVLLIEVVNSLAVVLKMLSNPPLDETHLDVVKGLFKLRGFHLSASTNGARWSDVATSYKDKQVCFMLMPMT